MWHTYAQWIPIERLGEIFQNFSSFTKIEVYHFSNIVLHLAAKIMQQMSQNFGKMTTRIWTTVHNKIRSYARKPGVSVIFEWFFRFFGPVTGNFIQVRPYGITLPYLARMCSMDVSRPPRSAFFKFVLASENRGRIILEFYHSIIRTLNKHSWPA